MDASIIVPAFNARPYLAGLAVCLRPYAARGVEIIFVDDGSTDDSLEAFKELVPEAVCLRQDNAGVAAARNTGVKAARGEFVQLLDADDTISADKLEAQMAFARREKLDVVYSDWRMVIVEGEKITREPFGRAEAPVEIVEALIGGWCAAFAAYLIRRDAYGSVGGSDGSLVNAQDYDLLLRLGIAGKRFGYCPGEFTDYHRYVNAQSLARGPRRQYWSDYEKATHKALALLKEAGALTTARKRSAAVKLHFIARNVYPMDKAWFKRLINEVFELDPQFKPPGSAVYRAAARFFGLARAEAMAVLTRRFKTPAHGPT